MILVNFNRAHTLALITTLRTGGKGHMPSLSQIAPSFPSDDLLEAKELLTAGQRQPDLSDKDGEKREDERFRAIKHIEGAVVGSLFTFYIYNM